MHPASSIILFTTLTGLGFGLMAWLGTGLAADPRLAALALGLAGVGLLASLAHLGQPTRFLKAFSQWRSSWLSREAILAMATLCLFALYAGLWLGGVRLLWLGLGTGVLALATVVCTAMIYAQMRSVPRWRSPLTPLLFLLCALTGGALFTGAAPAGGLLLTLGLAQILDWVRGDQRFQRAGSTLATATGLGALGRPRLFAPPHSGTNYLLREMVHVVGRSHAGKLRAIGLLLATVVPLGLILLPAGPAAHIAASLTHVAGVLILRWLFFAQAEHVVGLYYGKR